MISTRGKFIKVVATTVSAAMFTMATPAVLWNDLGNFAVSLIPEKIEPVESRLLTSVELGDLSGKSSGTPNPYIAGQSKWGVNYRGVDLLTGNFSFSETDLSFEGGYGIPVAITRTYSANNPDEGPLGKGWTLSVDLRTTAGGLLKGGGSPARSVPVKVTEKPMTAQQPGSPHWGPSGTSEPTEGVISEDASGRQNVVQRDVDGFLSPPAWDKNKVEVVYDNRLVNGVERRYTDHVTITTPEGTIYYYDEFGFENDPANPGVAPGLSTVMKIQTVTDRHGNVTTYTYGSTIHSYSRWTGTVYEQRLMAIDMPGGRGFDFGWNSDGRITSVTDGSRAVSYTYSNTKQIASVTKPGNSVTEFEYGDLNSGLPSIGTLLRKITDPRDQVTSVYYKSGPCYTPPLDVADIPYSFIDGVFCYKVSFPNSSTMYVQNPYVGPDQGEPQPGTLTESEIVTGMTLIVGGNEERTFHIKAGVDAEVLTVAVMDGAEAVFEPYTLNQYDTNSQDLLVSESYVYNPQGSNDLDADRHFDYSTFNYRPNAPAYLQRSKITTTTSYNFFGAPLSKTIAEDATYLIYPGASYPADEPTKNIYYAYWGADKYFQQKAVIDPKGKVSFTDYFLASDPAGKGQVKTVFDDKHCNFTNTNPLVTGWRDVIAWQSGPAAATFTYDEEGRPLNVTKMAPTGGTTVTTKTTYSDAPGTHGNATKIEEDFGGINRTTETLLFDSVGRARQVKDATNRTIQSTYDDLGNVIEVKRISGTPKVLASYDYGDVGLNFGMLLSAVDGVSGQSQEITYYSVNEPVVAARGQVWQVKEYEQTSLLPLYTTEYTYNSFGDRSKSKHTTPNGVREYTYTDYVALGTSDDKRAFKTMTAVIAGQSIQPEQFHYAYDSAGRLVHTAFMQTTQPNQPYSGAYPALARAHAYYLYDSGGRISELYNFFDNYDNTGPPQNHHYNYTNITGQKYDYDDQSGLRTQTLWKESNVNGWFTQRTETYGYDELGQLLSANYGNGSESWTYDGAGNRSVSGYTYDKLNRMTASPGGAVYQNDILGNRTWKNYQQSSVQRYVWDEMGRLNSLCGLTQGARYHYRVDGLRVKKVEGLTIQWVDDDSSESQEASSGHYDEIWSTNKPTTRYFYDGQMGFEDDYTINGGGGSRSVTVTRYALGARGIDGIETKVDTQSATAVYPVYDGHGNMIATLTRNGNSFTRANNREYGAWGDIRSGTGGDQGYVANLGHRKDSESGLTYMRARYYEPGTGRFISEDAAGDGWNWYVYCHSDPVNYGDFSGRDAWLLIRQIASALLFILGAELLNVKFEWQSVAGKLEKYINQIQAALKHGDKALIKAIGGGDDLAKLTDDLKDAQSRLNRVRWLQRGIAFTKFLGYMLILKALLIDIDIACDGPGGLEIVFGGG